MAAKGVVPRIEKTFDDLRWETFFKYYFFGHTEEVDELLCEDLELSSDEVETWVEGHPPAAIDIARYKNDYEALSLEVKNALPRKKLQEVGFFTTECSHEIRRRKNQTPKKTPPPPRVASKTPTPQPTPTKTPSKTPAKATPAKATPAKATPAKATPAKTTPAKSTPAKATPSKTPTKTQERELQGQNQGQHQRSRSLNFGFY